MIEKTIEIGTLFDFYGKLLSDKQYTAVELYYIHDLSLSEVGDQLNISRQGVYDTLKRAENNLYMYERKLGLVNKFNSNKEKIKLILKYIDKINEEGLKVNSNEIISDVEKIRKIALDILGK